MEVLEEGVRHMKQPLLETKNLGIQFGGLKAVDGLDLQIFPQELVGLIGPNGAGKTTVFNLLTSVYKPTTGQVFFNGEDTLPLRPFELARGGIARTFQNIRLFKSLSVLDNVRIAGAQRTSYGIFGPLLLSQEFLQQEESLKEKSLELLHIFGLDVKAQEIAGSLSYGEQRKLEIVRALATDPRLICLDEPAAGLNHQETHDLMKTIGKIRQDFKLAVLLIEHDMKLVMGICERIFVLDHGVKIAEGTPKEIQNSKTVIEAYLGPEELA